MIDMVIVAVVGGAVAAILWKKVKDHKSGKGGCSCAECGGCGTCGGCGGGCPPQGGGRK